MTITWGLESIYCESRELRFYASSPCVLYLVALSCNDVLHSHFDRRYYDGERILSARYTVLAQKTRCLRWRQQTVFSGPRDPVDRLASHRLQRRQREYQRAARKALSAAWLNGSDAASGVYSIVSAFAGAAVRRQNLRQSSHKPPLHNRSLRSEEHTSELQSR